MNTTQNFIEEDVALHLAEFFRALGDASRVRIIAALAEGEMNVGTLAEIVGISESAVSHHLRSLRQMMMLMQLPISLRQPAR